MVMSRFAPPASIFLLTLAFNVLPGPSAAQDEGVRFEARSCAGCSWFKGNTHTHTTESDGDSSPEYVAGWYKDHGYRFLILSDHNTLTDIEPLNHLSSRDFLLIPGEEVTSGFDGRPVHVNGLNLYSLVEPRREATLVATLQANVNAVNEAGAVPHVNHPNFGWALSPEDLTRVGGYRLLEIFNGHPSVHNQGGGGYPGMEEVWDILLTRGKRIFGIAVDDAHHFQGEFAPDRANPGRGWVAVETKELSAEAVMEALEEGRFYASTGVELEEVVAEANRLEIRIRDRGDFRYTTTFIGAGGRVLGQSYGTRAVFHLTQPESYVRARVRDSGGSVAWVQPFFVERN
jgi:hypothetical protein